MTFFHFERGWVFEDEGLYYVEVKTFDRGTYEKAKAKAYHIKKVHYDLAVELRKIVQKISENK